MNKDTEAAFQTRSGLRPKLVPVIPPCSHHECAKESVYSFLSTDIDGGDLEWVTCERHFHWKPENHWLNGETA